MKPTRPSCHGTPNPFVPGNTVSVSGVETYKIAVFSVISIDDGPVLKIGARHASSFPPSKFKPGFYVDFTSLCCSHYGNAISTPD
jgi:hypothetical protein